LIINADNEAVSQALPLGHSELTIIGSQTSTMAKTMAEMNDDELRAALIEAQSELKLYKPKKIAPERASCAFLNKFPSEIRDRIYKNLLISDELAKPRSIGLNGVAHIVQNQYDLHPAILRTCNQIHDEASPILYEKNTFILELFHFSGAETPIARSPDDICMLPHEFDITTYPIMKKIKHWKVMISASTNESRDVPMPQLIQFCRSLCDTNVQTLEIAIIPQGREFEMPPPLNRVVRYHPIEKLLQPLRLLRNLQNLEIAEVEYQDLPARLQRPVPPDFQGSHIISDEFVAELQQLTQGNSPAERVFKQYENLLTYAKAFERDENFKSEMEPIFGHVKSSRSRSPFYYRGSQNNPYLQMKRFHPVEEALMEASVASEDNDGDLFRMARAAVVEYLEAQYQRMSDAALQVTEFVKAMKTAGSIFSPSAKMIGYTAYHPIWVQGLVLLLEYAWSFERDVPSYIRHYVLARKSHLVYGHSIMQREQLVEHLVGGLDHPLSFRYTYKYVEWFKEALDDMDKQYLEIRAARRALFDYDIKEPGCSIDLELWRCDEMINWEVNEPMLCPEFDPSLGVTVESYYASMYFAARFNLSTPVGNHVFTGMTTVPLVPVPQANPTIPTLSVVPSVPLASAVSSAPIMPPHAGGPATIVPAASGPSVNTNPLTGNQLILAANTQLPGTSVRPPNTTNGQPTTALQHQISFILNESDSGDMNTDGSESSDGEDSLYQMATNESESADQVNINSFTDHPESSTDQVNTIGPISGFTDHSESSAD
jgi:hypothetical protein